MDVQRVTNRDGRGPGWVWRLFTVEGHEVAVQVSSVYIGAEHREVKADTVADAIVALLLSASTDPK